MTECYCPKCDRIIFFEDEELPWGHDEEKILECDNCGMKIKAFSRVHTVHTFSVEIDGIELDVTEDFQEQSLLAYDLLHRGNEEEEE